MRRQPAWRQTHVAGNTHHAGAVEPGAPNLERDGVEGVGGSLPHPVAGRKPEIVGVAHQPHHGLLRNRDALGLPGGTGSVDGVGKVGGTGWIRKVVLAQTFPGTGWNGIGSLERFHAGRGDHPAQPALCREQRPPRVGGNERDIGATSLDHREHGHQCVQRLGHADTDQRFEAHPALAQMPGQPVGAPVQFPVGPA